MNVGFFKLVGILVDFLFDPFALRNVVPDDETSQVAAAMSLQRYDMHFKKLFSGLSGK